MINSIEMSFFCCRHCGIFVGIPKVYCEKRSYSDLYCPNGHQLNGYINIEDKLRYISYLKESGNNLMNQINALKAANLRYRNRSKRGEHGKRKKI